ncbi:dual specificity testis-specific protein kinase 2-like [Sycon ciliatum]|uniref:dual specificity testis-specific protein kinase 2-like n=1 Tax=Sycon ciliatum TaxID=27933 RepID=UPI0020A906F5|eukprot:scpid37171/ scgid35638/ Dual specificity testis-specific protein kinase 1; Testicular protein kinase 1
MAATASENAINALEQRSSGDVASPAARPSSLQAAHMPDVVSRSCAALRLAVTGLTRLDDFDRELIGSGFFANVYKVQHLVTQEVMVLKLAKSGRSQTTYRTDPNSTREVEIMKSLSHPKILRFHGVCVHEGHLHPLVEYINGGVLEELLLDHSREVAWPLRFKLSLDIAEGMAYLHSKGMFHRDLTSKNVLLRVEGEQMEAVVADFGLAAKIPCVTGAVLSVVGTPYWMAPEVLNGEPYNEKADVFSFGIILCEILTRVGADPENLPRTRDFGLNVGELMEMVAGAPPILVRLGIHCCQLAPERRLTFALIASLLNRHRGQNMFNEINSRMLIVEESAMGSASDSPLTEGEHPFSHLSPCCSPVPSSTLLSSNSSTEILQCLSPPFRSTSSTSQLPSPSASLDDSCNSILRHLTLEQPDGGTPQDQHLHAVPGTMSTADRDVLDEYVAAKSECLASPESLSSASMEDNASPTPFSFPAARDIMEQLVSSASACSSPTPALPPSPPSMTHQPSCAQAVSSPAVPLDNDISSSGGAAASMPITTRAASDSAGGKSPRPRAAWRAKHQRSASLSKYRTRPFPCLADQPVSSAPSSPTSSRAFPRHAPPINIARLEPIVKTRPRSATPTMEGDY